MIKCIKRWLRVTLKSAFQFTQFLHLQMPIPLGSFAVISTYTNLSAALGDSLSLFRQCVPFTGPLFISFSQQCFLLICLAICCVPNRVVENGDRVPKTGKFPRDSEEFPVHSRVEGGVANSQQVQS